jgi:isochorismate hydrolase
MGPHTVTPYRMPTVAHLPSPARYGRCHAERCLLVVHDMQHGFLRAFAGDRSPALELVHNIAKIRDTCRELGVPIAYSAVSGAQPWPVLAAVGPRPRDLRLRRRRDNGARQETLAAALSAQDCDQVIVTGLHARGGCLRTAMDAHALGVEAFFVADAVADYSRDKHEQALRSAAEHAVPTTSGTVIGELLGVLR